MELPECSTSNNNELSNDNYSVFPIISNGHCTIDEVYPQDSLSENNSVNDSLSINANSQTNPVNNVNKDSISYLGLKVINLSKVNITESQEKVLIKGITFVPTPETADRAQIHQDVSDFCRRLRLKLHFSAPLPAIDEINNEQGVSGEVEDTDPPQRLPKSLLKFKPKSTWTPKTTDPILNAYISKVKSSIQNLVPQESDRTNLTKREKRAIGELKKNPHIVIKKADKGSSIVIMNRDDYIKEAETQLSDDKYYVETSRDLTNDFHETIQSMVNECESNGHIRPEIANCLRFKNPKTASLYLLPKIHKIKQAGEFPKGRPIISANGCPTERISAFVDENIKGIVPELKSYIKDTTDFIHKIESIIVPENCILVTFDVVSLYTNIPNDEGIRSVARALQKCHPPLAAPRIVLKFLKEVLHKNVFNFNGKNYLQVGGTAMGTKLAPSYANIFMGDLEQKLLQSAEKEPFFWVRFIDDVFCIWTHGQESLEKFHEHLNSQHPTIKFTKEQSTEKIVFLDTWVKKPPNSNSLEVELYTKPTDTHNYLHFSSFHPGHTKRGGPFGQFLRVRRNCTRLDDYDKHSKVMKAHYTDRGYPSQQVEGARQKARQIDRSSLLDPSREKEQKNENIVPLVLTHHMSNQQVRKVVLDNWGIFQYSERCKEIFPEKPLFATRRGTNLRDILIRSRLDPYAASNITGRIIKNPWEPCKKSNCDTCSQIQRNRLHSTTLNKAITSNQCHWQCTTTNVVYLLTCSSCKKQYVGETKRAFLVRYKEHLADIKHKRDKPVAKHINSHKDGNSTLQVNILEVCNMDPDSEGTTMFRRKREVHWIYTFRTLFPEGLNALG